MITTVIKRDGARVPFDSNKIRKAILAASQEAGLSIDTAQATASRVMASILQYTSDQEEIFTDELRNLILEQLDQIAPSVSRVWREHDKKNKKIAGDEL